MSWDPIALFEALDDSVAVYEPDGRFVYVNAATERLFGHPRERLLSARIWELCPEARESPLYPAFQRVAATGCPESFEHHFAPWDRWYRNQIYRLGGLIHVVASDITDAVRTEARIQAVSRAAERAVSAANAEANRTLNAIIQASPAAIMLIDLDGTVQLWNPAAERIFGWSAAEVLGKPLPTVAVEHREEFLLNLAKITRGECITGMETRRATRDRGDIDVALWDAPVQRPDGAVQCLCVVADISDRKRAEEAARIADRRKDEFLAMLGHELRNPLAPILTALHLMKLKEETGAERERALIERQTRHLVRLVDDLLDISRITRGKLDLNRSRTDLGAVLAQAVEMASPLLEQRGHHLTITAPRGVIHVDGDPVRLAQVFQNLLTNAAKYTPRGGRITLQLHVAGGSAVTEIEDNGEGIPPQLLPTIFEPFVQGERTIDRAQGGLGIGLALVRSIVTLHGGGVEAHSEGAGLGSRFVVRLPLRAGLEAEALVPRPGSQLPAGAIPRRVLLVDDNQDAAEMLAALLRAAGHELRVAHDGPAALHALASFTPEIALLDIGLPVMDGYELAQRLRTLLPSGLRLVAITGYGQEHDRKRSQEAGFIAHLVKPVELAQVLAVLEDPAS
jgi:PAS domain S-box-containing protein